MTLERPLSSRRPPVSDGVWLATLERAGRDVALVIADEPLATVIGELYREYGYDAVAPETPLAVIQTLLSSGGQIGVVIISPDARWAHGFREFLADEYPEIDRLVLAA